MRKGGLSQYRGFGRNAWLYLLSNTLQSVTAGAIGVLYTLFLTSLGYSDAFTGLVIFLGVVGGGIGILPAGPLVDRYGWKVMLLWSDLIGGVAIALQLFVPTRPMIVATTLGVGASVAIVLVINNPLLAASSTPRERSALFGLNNALSFLATALGSLLGGVLPVLVRRPNVAHSGLLAALNGVLVPGTEARSYQLALLITGVIALPSIFPIFWLRDEHHQRRRRRSPLTSPLTSPLRTPTSATSAWAFFHLPQRAVLRTHLGAAWQIGTGVIGRFSASQAVLAFGVGMFAPYINLYFVRGLGTSVPLFGAISTVQTGLVALAALVSAPLANRYGRLPVAATTLFVALPFLLLLGFSPPFGLALAAYLIHSGISNISQSPIQVYLMEAVPETSRGLASEVYNGAWQVAWAIGAFVGGWLISWGGYGLPFFVAVACYLLSLLLLVRWFAPDLHLPSQQLPAPDSSAPSPEPAPARDA